jgi:hypothetical protein
MVLPYLKGLVIIKCGFFYLALWIYCVFSICGDYIGRSIQVLNSCIDHVIPFSRTRICPCRCKNSFDIGTFDQNLHPRNCFGMRDLFAGRPSLSVLSA